MDQDPIPALKIYSKKAISEICSAVGKPIQLDPLTAKHERLLYARALVDVPASKPPPTVIDIIIEGIEYKLPIEFEWIPPPLRQMFFLWSCPCQLSQCSSLGP